MRSDQLPPDAGPGVRAGVQDVPREDKELERRQWPSDDVQADEITVPGVAVEELKTINSERLRLGNEREEEKEDELWNRRRRVAINLQSKRLAQSCKYNGGEEEERSSEHYQ